MRVVVEVRSGPLKTESLGVDSRASRRWCTVTLQEGKGRPLSADWARGSQGADWLSRFPSVLWPSHACLDSALGAAPSCNLRA